MYRDLSGGCAPVRHRHPIGHQFAGRESPRHIRIPIDVRLARELGFDRLSVFLATVALGLLAFDLAGAADKVTVDILSPSGQVLDSVNMGAQAAGRHSFDWNTGSYQGTGKLSYRVNATLGQTPVASTTMVREKVVSVGAVNGALSLQLQSGRSVGYSEISAIL